MSIDTQGRVGPTWAERFDEFDTCPWPGPRPLRRGDEGLLVGRDDDRKRFLYEVDTHRLVILAGASGVGKSSLLDAGLIPDLCARDRYTVVVCREWGSAAGAGEDEMAYLGGKVRAALAGAGVTDPPPAGEVLWWLDQKYGNNLVIVLDQFEELLRFDRELRDRVIDLLIDMNRELRVKLIISLRTEHLYELRKLERNAQPFQLSRFILEEIEPSYAADVIRAPEGSPVVGHVIDEDVVDELAERWMHAVKEPTADANDPFGRVGLLHLQALLYVLHDRAGRGPVTAATVRAFDEEVGSSNPVEMCRRGVEQAVDVKLRRCEEAFRERGVDDYRLEGTQAVLVRTVHKLSSGTYKLVVSAQQLAQEVLANERGLLTKSLRNARQTRGANSDGELVEGQLDRLEDSLLALAVDDSERLLFEPRAALAALADGDRNGPGSWASRLHEGADVEAADPDELSCGPVAGLAPAAVLIEELRRFALMLAWLNTAKLVRVTRPTGRQLMVSLIHDGFGEALRRWAERRRREAPASEALHALTVPQGVSFEWGDTEILDGDDGYRVLANLRWRGDTVIARFRRVVFVSCDFRGALFLRCSFEGVTFVSCRLDGTLFSDCTVRGGVPALESETPSDEQRFTEPTFTVAAPENRLLDALPFYQRVPVGRPKVLFAPLIGSPATLATPELERSSKMQVEPAPGGVVFYGGRLSAFTARNTAFVHGAEFGRPDLGAGRLSLRHVAGSGVNFVEQSKASFEIFDSGLRHVAITPEGAAGADDGVDLTVTDSLIVQAWIGMDIPLTGRAVNSHLVQFFDAAGPGRMKIDSRTRVDLCVGLTNHDDTPIDPPPDPYVAHRGRRTDYARGTAAESHPETAGAAAT